MIKLEKMRCSECGNKKFKMTNIKGQIIPVWKSYTNIELKVDCLMPVCQECKNMSFRAWEKDCQRLDEALEKSI